MELRRQTAKQVNDIVIWEILEKNILGKGGPGVWGLYFDIG